MVSQICPYLYAHRTAQKRNIAVSEVMEKN